MWTVFKRSVFYSGNFCRTALRTGVCVGTVSRLPLLLMNRHMAQWKVWDPQHLVSEGSSVVLMILNQPLTEGAKAYLKHNWKNAVLRIAVDGGLNQLKEVQNDECLIPDIISGDFDSVTPETLSQYTKLGSDVIHTPDQDECDFTKALRVCSEAVVSRNLKADAVLAFAQCTDRLDHLFGNLNTLYLKVSSIPVYLFGADNLTWLLEAGNHKIIVGGKMAGKYAGLVPLGHPCSSVTTSGLVWNLNQSGMEFGGLISVCNKFDGSDCVTVMSDTRILWTMEFKLYEK